MEVLRLQDIDKMSRKELRQAIQNCFDAAPDQSEVDRLAFLQEAQLYGRELERRSDSRTSIRDFVLEIVVIILIGWEIRLGYRQDRDQTLAFQQQQAILSAMQTSAQATANTLTSLEKTTEAMNGAVQNQLALLYYPSVSVMFDASKKMRVLNYGRTNIVLWGNKLGDAAPFFLTAAHVMPPNAGYEFDATGQYAWLKSLLKERTSLPLSLDIYLKNELGVEYVVECTTTAVLENDEVRIVTQINAITRKQWSRK